MSKRTIVIVGIALLSILAIVVSMYFEYKSTIDEANKVLAGDEPDQAVRSNPRPVKGTKDENKPINVTLTDVPHGTEQ